MRRSVRWSRDALDDINEQLRYIAWDSPDAADSVRLRILEAADKLGETPTGRPGRVGNAYEKSVAGLSYILAYAIDITPAGEEVVILRLIHTSRDWQPGSWPN